MPCTCSAACAAPVQGEEPGLPPSGTTRPPLLLGDTPSRLSKRGSGTAGHRDSGVPLVNKGRSVFWKRPPPQHLPDTSPPPPSTTTAAAAATALHKLSPAPPASPFLSLFTLFCLTQYFPDCPGLARNKRSHPMRCYASTPNAPVSIFGGCFSSF